VGPGLTDRVVVVVVVVAVFGLLIVMVGPPLPPQATPNDTMAMLEAMARNPDRWMFRSVTSRPRSCNRSIVEASPVVARRCLT
jgi:hypothetical protein